jgi:hypothetical protein
MSRNSARRPPKPPPPALPPFPEDAPPIAQRCPAGAFPCSGPQQDLAAFGTHLSVQTIGARVAARLCYAFAGLLNLEPKGVCKNWFRARQDPHRGSQRCVTSTCNGEESSVVRRGGILCPEGSIRRSCWPLASPDINDQHLLWLMGIAHQRTRALQPRSCLVTDD